MKTKAVELAADSVLLAIDALQGDFGAAAAAGLIRGVYADAIDDVVEACAREAAEIGGGSLAARQVALAVGQRVTERVVDGMSALMLGSMLFAGQAVADLAAATRTDVAEATAGILGRLRDG